MPIGRETHVRAGAWLGFLVSIALPWGCGEDEVLATERGAPALSTTPGKPTAVPTKKPTGTAPAAAVEQGVDVGPPRPPVALDSKSFSRRRDPFQSFVAAEMLVAEPSTPRADRKVEMAKYAFEDLKLIAIVNSGRGVTPRALFLASDGKSQTIEQGEYFSSAEVLLAAVNRDYVEIEVVDDDLATSLNLQRGERRAIYLRND